MEKEDLKQSVCQTLKEQADEIDKTSTVKSRNSIMKTALFLTSICFAVVIVSQAIVLFSSEKVTGPYGKIIEPLSGITTGKEVGITGETWNFEPGQYVWQAVDKPKIGLCWPKSPQIIPNTEKKTTIYEGGPREPYTVSLSVVNKTINDQWQQWLEKRMFGRQPLLPDKRRLDSVILILGS